MYHYDILKYNEEISTYQCERFSTLAINAKFLLTPLTLTYKECLNPGVQDFQQLFQQSKNFS